MISGNRNWILGFLEGDRYFFKEVLDGLTFVIPLVLPLVTFVVYGFYFNHEGTQNTHEGTQRVSLIHYYRHSTAAAVSETWVNNIVVDRTESVGESETGKILILTGYLLPLQ